MDDNKEVKAATTCKVVGIPGGPEIIHDILPTQDNKCLKCAEFYGCPEKNGLCTLCFVNTSISKIPGTKLKLSQDQIKVAALAAMAMDESEFKTLMDDHKKIILDYIKNKKLENFHSHDLIYILLHRIPNGYLFTVKQLFDYLSIVRGLLKAHNLLLQRMDVYCLDDQWSIFAYSTSDPWDIPEEVCYSDCAHRNWIGLDSRDNCSIIGFFMDYIRKINTTDLKLILRNPKDWVIRT